MATFLAVNYVSAQADIVLGADVTAGATSFTVTVPTIQTGFGIVNPSGVGIYKCVIESEIIHFTSGAVTAGTQTWTMVRAQEQTTGVIHTANTPIKLENTAGAWGNALQLSPTAQQTGTANISGAITSGGLLTGTGLSAPHASSHDVGGSDVLKDLTRLAAGPAINEYTAWSSDSYVNNGGTTPSAGVIYLTKILTAHAYIVSTIDFGLRIAGTGVTALANCFVGIYDSGGTRRYVSADQSSNWATNGSKSLALGGSAYTVTANDFIYIAFLVGTQSTTNVQFIDFGVISVTQISIGLTAAKYRWAQNSTSQTSLPSSLTLSSNTIPAINPTWFGVK